MPRTQEARTWLDFHQTVADRVGSKAAVVALTGTGTELWRLEQGERVSVDLLHSLWTSPGQFYATGHVEVDARWQVARWPLTEEAKGIEKALGLSVYAAYSRGDGPNPFPAPPEPEPVPEPPPAMEFR